MVIVTFLNFISTYVSNNEELKQTKMYLILYYTYNNDVFIGLKTPKF